MRGVAVVAQIVWEVEPVVAGEAGAPEQCVCAGVEVGVWEAHVGGESG